jgi:hypothetical protein
LEGRQTKSYTEYFHGTGDIFASVTVGALMRGKTLEKVLEKQSHKKTGFCSRNGVKTRFIIQQSKHDAMKCLLL